MTNTPISLNDLRAQADNRYGMMPVQFGNDGEREVRFRNLLRVPDFERKQFADLGERLQDSGIEEQPALIREMLTVVAHDKAEAAAFFADVGEDFGLIAYLLERYIGDTQAGEAEGSQN